MSEDLLFQKVYIMNADWFADTFTFNKKVGVILKAKCDSEATKKGAKELSQNILDAVISQ